MRTIDMIRSKCCQELGHGDVGQKAMDLINAAFQAGRQARLDEMRDAIEEARSKRDDSEPNFKW